MRTAKPTNVTDQTTTGTSVQVALAGLDDAAIQAAMTRFRARVAAGRLSPAIAGVARIKRLDASGDSELVYPRVDLSRLDELELDERVAVATAERIIAEARAHHANIVATRPGSPTPTRLSDFDPALAPDEIVILNPITGG